jgi:uncharacterized membrane protein
MSTWRYARSDGQPSEPTEASALQDLIRNGTLSPQTLVWKEGMSNWVPANTLPDFANIPAPSATDSPSPPNGGIPAIGATPPPVSATAVDAADIAKNKAFAVLAYIGLLFLVPLLAAPESRFARYHTNQGIVLFLAAIIANAGVVVLMFLPFVGCLATPLTFVTVIGPLVLMVMGIVNAASGVCKPLPLIGQYQILN